MTKARYADKFKEETVRQVIERGYTVPDVANRLGVSAALIHNQSISRQSL